MSDNTVPSSASTSRGDVDVAANLAHIHGRIQAVCKDYSREAPRLVAVSKTKPLSLILDAYRAGQRVFGENYIQELKEKSLDPEAPADIEWRFIGSLQSNKCNMLAQVKGLAAVETITSEKLATKLNAAFAKTGREDPVAVFIQVNTSGEENKGGVEPGAASELAAHIVAKCPLLKFRGLMTIGMLARSKASSETDNEDFQTLVETRAVVASALGLAEGEVELSMGMSSDFENAIAVGSTSVRIGSTIFGARSYPPQSS